MANSKYEVTSLTLDQLLAPGQTLFEVPQFQRSYSWTRDEIGQLISDLFAESKENDLPYFLGSLVLAQSDRNDPAAPNIVLDGQQRLATISLMIAALIDLLQGKDVAEYKSRILVRTSVQESRRQPKLRLQQQDAKDFEALIQAPNSRNEKKYNQSNIGKALRSIYDHLNRHKDTLPFVSMLERLLYRVEIVHILAPNEQDAFRLFETLNDRGLALNAADLIKNKLFSKCSSNDIDDAIEAWNTMLSTLADEDIVDYLRYWWLAFNGFVRTRELYKNYKDLIDNMKSNDAGLFAIEIQEPADIYATIARPAANRERWDSPEVADTLERLNNYRARSCRPVLLAGSIHLPDKIIEIARICESITVRYLIVGEYNSNNLERTYVRICEKISKKAGTLSDIFDKETLSEIPQNEEFIDKLASMEIGTQLTAWRTILCQINDFQGSRETYIRGADKVHIEHILPQKPAAKALREAGFHSLDEASGYISRIGNLTLLSSLKNKIASNKSFSEKRNMYNKSEIWLTHNLLLHQQWSADAIDKRSKELAHIAAEVFPHPVKIAEASGS